MLASTFFEPSVYWHYLWWTPILRAVGVTLLLAVISQAIGIVLGVFAALGRMSTMRLPFVRWLAHVYIWLFRGTPLLVQLAFVYFAFPQATGILFNEFWSAAIALSLNEGAYMAEIVRAGITSVEGGQMEAAQSLGMTRGLAMRRIVLPQAVRIIIPPTGNEFISMLKNTSLAYSISAVELWQQTIFVFTAQKGPGAQQYFTLILVAATWYLILTTIFSFFQRYLERYFERGFTREIRGPSMMTRAFGFSSRAR